MNGLIATIVNEVLNPLIFLFFGLAVVIFLYGLVLYVANADNPEKRKIGQRHIAWGIIGFVIMTGAWGILFFFDNALSEISPDGSTLLDNYQINLENDPDPDPNPGGGDGQNPPDDPDPVQCETGQIPNCYDLCVSSTLLGNGLCDSGLNCIEYGYDNGDCALL